mgnify:FL=1
MSIPPAVVNLQRRMKREADIRRIVMRERVLSARSRRMKEAPTSAEALMRKALFYFNIPYEEQVVVGRYIVDFLLTDRNTVLEVDGGFHQFQAVYDRAREEYLRRLGWQIVRVRNQDVSTEWVRTVILPLPRIHGGVNRNRVTEARALEAERRIHLANSRPVEGGARRGAWKRGAKNKGRFHGSASWNGPLPATA